MLARPSRVSWPHRGAPPKAPVAGSACVPPPHFGAPLTRFVELHGRLQWQGPHAYSGPLRRTPHTFRGPIGSSTKGSTGRVRMRTRAHFGEHLTRFVAPWGAPPKAPAAGSSCVLEPTSANTSHVSWPHRVPHRRSQLHNSHAHLPSMSAHTIIRFAPPQGSLPTAPVTAPACVTAPISAHPSHASWPHGELHRRPPVAVPTCVPAAHFGTPLTRFVAP